MNPISSYINKLESKESGYVCIGFLLWIPLFFLAAFTMPDKLGGFLRRTADLVHPQEVKLISPPASIREYNQTELNIVRWLSFNLGYLDQSFTAAFKCQEAECTEFFFTRSRVAVEYVIDQVQELNLDKRIEDDLRSLRNSLEEQEDAAQPEGQLLRNYQKFCNIQSKLHKAIAKKLSLPNDLRNTDQWMEKRNKEILGN